MAGYYEQLQGELERATERGVPRRGLIASRRRLWAVGWRLRADWIAVGLAVVCSIAVAFVFTQVGVERADRPRPTARRSTKVAVIRNYAPTTPPAMGGQMVCDSALAAPGGAATPAGTAVVNTRPSTGFVYRVTASGLKPTPRGEVYEVWLELETQTTGGAYVLLNGEAPLLLGAIAPTVGLDGRLAVEGLVPPTVTGGTYRMLITLQARSARAPGRAVLVGDLPL